MNILKTLLFAPLAILISMPVYAHQYDHDGYSRFEKRIEHHHKGHHRKHHFHHPGNRYGWHKRPYGLYKKHHWHKRPYYGYRGHRYGIFDNDGWELILRLSDDF